MNIIILTLTMRSLKLRDLKSRAPKHAFINDRDSPEPRSSHLNFTRLQYRSNSYLSQLNRKTVKCPSPEDSLERAAEIPKRDTNRIVILTNANSLPKRSTCILWYVCRCIYTYVHAWSARLGLRYSTLAQGLTPCLLDIKTWTERGRG